MSLTPQQEAFAQAVASGLSQSDAYRKAYKVKPTTKAETTWKRACELMADGKVSGRVAEIKQQLEAKGLWSREQSVLALIAAMGEGKPSEQIQAIKELNAMHGYNAPTQLNVSTRTLEPLSAEDWI